MAKPDPLAPWQVLISSLDAWSWLGTVIVLLVSTLLMAGYYRYINDWKEEEKVSENEGVVPMLLANLAFLLGISFQEAMDKVQ